MQSVGRSALVLGLLLLAILPAAAGEATLYVRNQAVPKPFVQRAGEWFVPAEVAIKLFGGALKSLEKTPSGAAVNGDATAIQPLDQGGRTWFPILALARHLKWEVRAQRDLGIIDVSSPRAVRTARAAAAEIPMDPREERLSQRAMQEVQRLFGPVITDAAVIERVERIGRKIAAACDRSNIRWTFHVLESKEVQAMSTGAGRIFVTRGLLRQMDDGDVAAVIAHEIGHGSRLHSTRNQDMADLGLYYLRMAEEARKKQDAIAEEFNRTGGTSELLRMRYQAARDEERDYLEKANGVVSQIKLAQSKTGKWANEYEADRMGMIYLARAGYHPMLMVHCLRSLDRSINPSLDAALQQALESSSTHPPLGKRAQIAEEVYQRYYGQGTNR